MKQSKAIALDQGFIHDLILDFSLLALITFLWLQ
jgi:hypothetical protein